MPGTREYALLEVPGVDGAGAEHIAAVVRFDNDGVAAGKFLFYQGGDAAEILQRGDLHTFLFCYKPEIICRVVGDGKGLEIDVADAEFAARFDPNGAVF